MFIFSLVCLLLVLSISTLVHDGQYLIIGLVALNSVFAVCDKTLCITTSVTCSPPSVTHAIHDLATVTSQVDAGLGPTLAPTTQNEPRHPPRQTVAAPPPAHKLGIGKLLLQVIGA